MTLDRGLFRSVLYSDYSLIYKHTEAIDDLASFGTGIFEQIGGWGVWYDIGHHHLRSKCIKIEIQTGIDFRKKAN